MKPIHWVNHQYGEGQGREEEEVGKAEGKRENRWGKEKGKRKGKGREGGREEMWGFSVLHR